MKQTIEIEVPEGKKAFLVNNQIKYVDLEPYWMSTPYWKSIKTFEDAYNYCLSERESFAEYINSYDNTSQNTYENAVAKLRMVTAVLTNNEKVSLVNGRLYYPVIQFCSENSIKCCYGKKIIGKIKTEGKEYAVVGGSAYYDSGSGLGCIYFNDDLTNYLVKIGFLYVSSNEIAAHLSTYFGKLIFEVMYRGAQCDWEWVE